MNTSNELNPMSRLQLWYKQQCDGEWEHSYGIKIGTVDNPGWWIEIDLVDTSLEFKPFNPVDVEINDREWHACRVQDSKFIAACDSLRLLHVVEIFLSWACSELND